MNSAISTNPTKKPSFDQQGLQQLGEGPDYLIDLQLQHLR
jgi:hypothetical protein